MSSALSNLFGKAPSMPRNEKQSIVMRNEKQSIVTRDETLRRLAKLRRATVTSQLSQPNIQRKQLGAGV